MLGRRTTSTPRGLIRKFSHLDMFRSNPSLLPSPNRETLARFFLLSILCTFSYIFSVYHNSRPHAPSPDQVSNLTQNCALQSDLQPLDFETHYSASAILRSDDLIRIEFCEQNFTDYCPCQDPNRERRFHTDNLLHRERHCPDSAEKKSCRVPRPVNYRSPIRWPESRDKIWFSNIPSTRLTIAKKDQNWVRVEGERLFFPGGGTSFPDGVKGYVTAMAKLLPLKTGEIRTALDIGCGVC